MTVLHLGNSSLALEVIDPAEAADCARLGPRFCWGGYLWQVRDAHVGELFSGPEYPHATPLAFNGQGAPEAFRWAELATGRHLTFDERRGFILGIGEAHLSDTGAPIVTRPCEWAVTRGAEFLEFCTRQNFGGWEVELTKTITLRGRTVTSATRLVNTGARALPLHWFAHPFFALTDRLITGELPAAFGIADNAGFALAAGKFAMKERYATKDDGHFELLRGAPVPLDATFTHPQLTHVRMTCDFVADKLPVWANSNTFSIEPYIIGELAPGATRAWSVRYEFGEPRSS